MTLRELCETISEHLPIHSITLPQELYDGFIKKLPTVDTPGTGSIDRFTLSRSLHGIKLFGSTHLPEGYWVLQQYGKDPIIMEYK